MKNFNIDKMSANYEKSCLTRSYKKRFLTSKIAPRKITLIAPKSQRSQKSQKDLNQ